MLTEELIYAVASYGLAGCVLAPPGRPASDEQWDELCRRVGQEGIAGFLVEAVSDGAWPATEAQAAKITELHAASAVSSLLLERELLAVLGLFDAAGIGYRVLKGSAYAHLIYPDPALRPFGDIDLLVLSEQIDAALGLLAAAGGTRRYAEPRPGFDRRFSKGACIVMPSGHEIDVHRTFVAGPFGLTIELPRLFATSTTFLLAGRAVTALAREERFLNACYHTVLGHRPPRLIGLRDVAQMVCDDQLDVDRVLRMARSWDAEVVVAHAVSLTWTNLRLAEVPRLALWAQRYRPGRVASRRLEVYTSAHRSYAGQAIAALRVISRPTDKAAYALAILLPKRAPNRAPALTRWRRGAGVLLQCPRQRNRRTGRRATRADRVGPDSGQTLGGRVEPRARWPRRLR